MSSNNNKSNVVDDAALLKLANVGGSQDRLAALLERKLELEQAEKDEAEAQKQAFRRATAEAALVTQRERQMMQDRCPHMKQNFRPATAGQKDHKGVMHIFCQFCQREFIGAELPYHLAPVTECGGPQ